MRKLSLSILMCGGLLLGCASNPKPLFTAGLTGSQAVKLVTPAQMDRAPVFSGAEARSNTGGGGGLIGGIITLSLNASSNANGSGFIRNLKEANQGLEIGILNQAVKAQLQKSGIKLSDSSGMQLRLTYGDFGLFEVQRELVSPFIVLKGTLVSSQGTEVWSGFARGMSADSSPLSAYQTNPALYLKRFNEAATDAARQLISGPIRPVTWN